MLEVDTNYMVMWAKSKFLSSSTIPLVHGKFSKNSNEDDIFIAETRMWCWPISGVIFLGYRLLPVVFTVFFGGKKQQQFNSG